MPDNNAKRQVNLPILDDIVAEANRLLQSGYESKGNWNLAQTSFHLTEWARFPMDGFPKPSLMLKAIFGLMKLVGYTDKMKKDILANGFSAGTPTAPDTIASPDESEDEQAVKALANVVERMKSYDGPLHASPLFGEMDREMWTKVTLLHCEHHFGFLHPKS